MKNRAVGAGILSTKLIDSFGRTIDYLRISITERCNLRCLYCMPSDCSGKIAGDEVMRFEDLLRICRILASIGISTVRVTGGEPLVRKGVADFIKEIKSIDGIKRVNMTTNGMLLGEHLQSLAAAGLDAINISLDTLDNEKFRHLAGREGLAAILPAIDRALALGLTVKINCVPLRGFNEEDIVRIAALAKDKKIGVRFIELMPLGAAAAMQPLPVNETAALIEKAFGQLTPSAVKPGSGPAVYYTLPGFAGYIGIIGALSSRFCEDCNRMRITSAGILKPCLASDIGIGLRQLLKDNASDREIEKAVRELVRKKPAGQNFTAASEKAKLGKIEMARIGG